jgi:1,2-diacylglycerol 3-alpha-glucosyltransferase
MMRVAVMIDNIGPYHVARLTAAARRMDVLAVEVRAKSKVYAWAASDLPSNVAYASLATAPQTGAASWRAIMAAIASKVGPFRADAIALPGWSALAPLAGLAWASGAGVPAVVMSDSNPFDFTRVRAAERFKSSILNGFSAGLCPGNSARNYLVSLGMPEAAVFLGYDVVDNDYFETRAAAVRAGTAMPAAEGLTVLDSHWRGRYFLASSRFVPHKNLMGLLNAYAAYRVRAAGAHEPWPLVILGDGPERGNLEAKRTAMGLDGTVHMPGFIQYEALPLYYATAGAFVHASRMEPWGLVVNEAMASGLPVAVSRRCGCAEMLVADGENGMTFDPADGGAMTDALWWLATHPDRERLGRTSAARIAQWGPDRFADGLAGACGHAIAARPRRLGRGMGLVVRAVAEIQARRA